MRKTVHKWFWAWDFDREERWLNEMATKGFALVAIGVSRYTFEESQPGEYNIRLELLENLPSHIDSENYIKFLEEMGVEYLGSIMRWVYYRKKTDYGEFDLYSDNSSRIQQLNRLLLFLGILALSELCIGISSVLIYFKVGTVFNLGAGFICLCLGSLLGYGYLHINQKKSKLKKEQLLYE